MKMLIRLWNRISEPMEAMEQVASKVSAALQAADPAPKEPFLVPVRTTRRQPPLLVARKDRYKRSLWR